MSELLHGAWCVLVCARGVQDASSGRMPMLVVVMCRGFSRLGHVS